MTSKHKKAWPTQAVMSQIYAQKLWGGKAFDFYSGDGSHNPDIVKPYLKQVIAFLKAHHNTLEVCDSGCGDFNIGKHLVPHSNYYHAVDIVPSLIIRNKGLFQGDNLEFHCLDISKDDLPKADCIILRQVLQHLSNAEILDITKNLLDYKYIILTEHLPNDDFTPNLDIISGQGIRLKKKSGVNLLAAPFHLKIKRQKILHEYVLDNRKGRIVTTLYQTK